MLIRLAYDIQFNLICDVPIVALLNVHPSREQDLLEPDELRTEPAIRVTSYVDVFGNRCSRFVAPAGRLKLSSTTLIHDSGEPDPVNLSARQIPVGELPNEVLTYLLNSRYCEVDRFSSIAIELFGWTTPGWARVKSICDWVNNKVTFNYGQARPTKTALDVFTERVGVCRDFQHLAITLTRCQNIPARYVTGYLGDIRWPYSGPGDFSAWYEVFLDGRWMAMDARHNNPRMGRVLMATGRDAADVAITTSFGNAILTNFYVDSYEVLEDGTTVPSLPGSVAREAVVTSANRASAGAIQGLAE